MDKLNSKYLNDIIHINKFMRILDNNENDDELDFWHLMLLISRSYINDNFHKMFNLINYNMIKKVFSAKATKDDYFNDCFLSDNDTILKVLLDNQLFEGDIGSNDYSIVVKIIRNHLSHYNYKYSSGIVSFFDSKYKITIKFSVATLVLILLAALSNMGQSNRSKAYESAILNINGLYFEVTALNLLEGNKYTPNDVIRDLTNNINGSNMQINCVNPEKIKLMLKYFEELMSLELKPHGYCLQINEADSSVIEMLNSYSSFSKAIREKDAVNLYQMVKSDIKLATISYKILIAILFYICNKKKINDIYECYIPILNNVMLICYLNIVFCDYAISESDTISNCYFEYIFPQNAKNIPKKIRNSLSHCHYRFQNIVDNNSDIIVEFWDEYNHEINFECKIKRENVYKLVESFISGFNYSK